MNNPQRRKRPVRQAPSPAEAWHRKVHQEEVATERLLRAVLRKSRQIDDVIEVMTGRRVWGTSRSMPDCSACAMSEICDGAECALFDYALGARHRVRNHFDQWELRYVAQHGGNTIPPTAYKAGTAAKYCAGNPSTCKLECVGCDRSREA